MEADYHVCNYYLHFYNISLHREKTKKLQKRIYHPLLQHLLILGNVTFRYAFHTSSSSLKAILVGDDSMETSIRLFAL